MLQKTTGRSPEPEDGENPERPPKDAEDKQLDHAPDQGRQHDDESAEVDLTSPARKAHVEEGNVDAAKGEREVLEEDSPETPYTRPD